MVLRGYGANDPNAPDWVRQTRKAEKTMDPDEALKQMRDALNGLYGVAAATVGTDGWLDAVKDLAEAAAAIDTWMANGGFLPAGWMIHRTETHTVTSLREQARLLKEVTANQKAEIDRLRQAV